MNTKQAIIKRLNELIKKQGITPNALSIQAGIPQSTIKSILNDESQNPGIVTIKKICDGFENPKITLADFFDADIFRTLEQEIK